MPNTSAAQLKVLVDEMKSFVDMQQRQMEELKKSVRSQRRQIGELDAVLAAMRNQLSRTERPWTLTCKVNP